MTHAWTLRLLATATIAIAIGSSSGCTIYTGVKNTIAYNDSMNDFVLGWRNRSWAKQAWHERKAQYVNQPYQEEFGKGFMDGYADAAAGGAQCVPPLPPRRYWSWKYQTAEGQGKVAAWYSGYPMGARVAEEESAHLWGEIQVSETLRAQYELGHEAPYPFPLDLYDAEKCCPETPVDGQIVPIEGAPTEAPGNGAAGIDEVTRLTPGHRRLARLEPPPQ